MRYRFLFNVCRLIRNASATFGRKLSVKQCPIYFCKKKQTKQKKNAVNYFLLPDFQKLFPRACFVAARATDSSSI